MHCCDALQRLSRGDPWCETAGISQCGEFGECSRVGSDPHVVDPGAAQWDWCSSGRHCYERATVADSVECRHSDKRGVERAVNPSRQDAPNSDTEAFGPGDELVRTKLSGERLVSRRRDRDCSQSAHRGELENGRLPGARYAEQTSRSRATVVGRPLIGHRKLLPTVTNRQPRFVRCSMITPLAATRRHARESFFGQVTAA